MSAKKHANFQWAGWSKILFFHGYVGEYVTWRYDGIGSGQLNQTPVPKAKLVMDKVPHYYRHSLSKYQRNTDWKCHHKNFNVDFCIPLLQTVQRMLKFTSI